MPYVLSYKDVLPHSCMYVCMYVYIYILYTLLKTNVATLGQIQEYKHVSYTGP